LPIASDGVLPFTNKFPPIDAPPFGIRNAPVVEVPAEEVPPTYNPPFSILTALTS